MSEGTGLVTVRPSAMTPRWVVAILVAEVVWSVAAQGLWLGRRVDYWPLGLNLAVGWAAVGAGLVAWSRRPANRTGPLFVAVGFAWSIPNLQTFEEPFLVGLSVWLEGLHTKIFLHLAVVFPGGRITSPRQQLLVAGGYSTLGLSLAQTLTNGQTPANGWLLWDNELIHQALIVVGFVAQALLCTAVVVMLARRWRHASAAARRVVAPALVVGLLLGLLYASTATIGPVLPRMGAALDLVIAIVSMLVPFAFVFGLLRLHLDHFAVSGLILELGRAPSPIHLQQALGRALHDPSLQILYWAPTRSSWMTTDGERSDLPPEGGRRTATVLRRRDEPVAALVHDPTLLDEADLMAAVSTATLMALENERLRAQVQTQLEEVSASRARIVEASQAERRRVERNLHDGAQQRLVSCLLALGLARAQADRVATDESDEGDEDGRRRGMAGLEVPRLLDVAAREVESAIEELRELAQGIHPAVLTDHGLPAAVEGLCERSHVPVTATVACGRYPLVTEGLAYFTVSESLANVAKHAGASSVRVAVRAEGAALHVDVVDNGRGGADPTRGSGLRSLADRIAALGGTFEVHSPLGGGTRVSVTLPCD